MSRYRLREKIFRGKLMNKKMIVDICGADAAPAIIMAGAVDALRDQNEYDIVLCGPKEVIDDGLGECQEDILQRIEVVYAQEAVTNYDNPTEVIRGKNETSMVKALCTLKERDDIVGMVSAGCTGSLLVGSIFRLGLFKGLKQPSLSSALLNTDRRYFCLCDCGANMSREVKDIVDYAIMGSAFMEAMNGVESPRVGLVNVGKEKGKGNDLAKECYDALEAEQSINFIGNIEGSDVLTDKADVVVCDGFTGNILLKTIEAAGMIAARMAGSPEDIVSFFDYNSQGGATFLGTKKIIVKAHGAAGRETVKACLDQGWRLEKGGFISKMASRMNR